MNDYSLFLVSKDDTLVVSVADIKSQVYVEHALDDADILKYLKAAIAYCESYTGCEFTDTVIDYKICNFNRVAYLPSFPIQEVLSVKYFDKDNDEQTLSSNAYTLMNPYNKRASVVFNERKNVYNRPDAVTIRYQVGYENLPEQAEAAIRLLAGHLYKNRVNEVEELTYKLKIGVHDLLNQISVSVGL